MPLQYILPRWRKTVKDIVAYDTINETNELDEDVTKARRANALYTMFLKIYVNVVEHEECYKKSDINNRIIG